MSDGGWIRAAGVDPGSTTGLVALAVPPSLLIDDARYIGSLSLSAGTSAHESKPQVRARLFTKIRAVLDQWSLDLVVLEEPYDALPVWGKGTRTGGAARGTIFSLGAHFGLAIAAAVDLSRQPRVVAYAVTSAREKTIQTKRGPRVKAERIGWMQRRLPRIPNRDSVIARNVALLRTLKERPANGVLLRDAEIAKREGEDVYMALGVLHFHFDRERGAV